MRLMFGLPAYDAKRTLTHEGSQGPQECSTQLTAETPVFEEAFNGDKFRSRRAVSRQWNRAEEFPDHVMPLNSSSTVSQWTEANLTYSHPGSTLT